MDSSRELIMDVELQIIFIICIYDLRMALNKSCPPGSDVSVNVQIKSYF